MARTFSFLFIMLIRINLIAEKTINPPLPFHILNVGKFGVEYLNLLRFQSAPMPLRDLYGDFPVVAN